jgi:hypothetical protein
MGRITWARRMNDGDANFLRRLIQDGGKDRRNTGVAARMAETEDIGKVVRGAKVSYQLVDLDRARNVLLSRGFDLEQKIGVFARSEAGRGGSEKTGAQRVTEGLVAVTGIGMYGLLKTPAGGFAAMNWETALALPYSVLLVCENLEPLKNLAQYEWLTEFYRSRPVLALFRGAQNWFKTDAAAKLIKRDTRPTLGFFDFDPKGLTFAASLPRREALCLPPWEVLEAATMHWRREHLFTNSAHVSRAQLDAVQDEQITHAWMAMKKLTLGLDQEHFPLTGKNQVNQG